MRNPLVLAATLTLACTAAFAQAPAGVVPGNPPAEVNPVLSGGSAAANAQQKVDDRIKNSNKHPASQVRGAGNSTAPAEINPTGAGGKPAARADKRAKARLMDTNKDGMVSKEEWDTYQAHAWDNMKPSAAGVSAADLDRLNRTPKVRSQQ